MENIINGNRQSGIMEIEGQRDKEMENKLYEDIDSQSGEVEKKQRSVKKKDSNSKSVKYIYYALGVLEVFFAFRFVFKILGANMESPFASFIYSTTNFFISPFAGIFRFAVTEGIETKSVLEPTLIIGMIVYALVALGIVKLIEISRKSNTPLS